MVQEKDEVTDPSVRNSGGYGTQRLAIEKRENMLSIDRRKENAYYLHKLI